MFPGVEMQPYFLYIPWFENVLLFRIDSLLFDAQDFFMEWLSSIGRGDISNLSLP